MEGIKTWSGYWGNLELGRYPLDGLDPTLQAWNGADRLMAAWLGENFPPAGAGARRTLLILNDAWGALCCLGVRLDYRVLHVTDSWLSMKSAQENMSRNGLETRLFAQVLAGGDQSWTQDPDLLAALAPGLDLALVHMPRNLDLLDWQLGGLSELTGSVALECPLVLGALDKDLVPRAREALDRHFGSHQLSRGEFKAHLALAGLVPGRSDALARKPARGHVVSTDVADPAMADTAAGSWPRRFEVPGHEGLVLFNWPGVFSRDGIDPAGLFLLETLEKTGIARPEAGFPESCAILPDGASPGGASSDLASPEAAYPDLASPEAAYPDPASRDENSPASRPLVIDLGCGNGLLALGLALKQPGYRYLCTDESASALDSARTAHRHLGKSRKVDMEFLLADCLDGVPDRYAALILCNPPFHVQGAQGLGVAARMFADSARVLTPEGSLVIVANRHLGHHRNLEKWFSSVTVLADNGTFMVIRAAHPHG